MRVDTTAWSGDGDFTIELLEILKGVDEIAAIRVEDAPASHSGAGFNFLVNEVFVTFSTATRRTRARWLGLVPILRRVEERLLTLAGLESRLAAHETVGPADYSDEGMLQYLRTERIVPAYQTRGYKLVELVRIYEAGTPRRT